MYKLIEYKIFNVVNKSVIKTNEDGSTTSIPFDPANTDYQQYLKWLDEGGVPLPAEETK
jgi:hypothetical protein